jgi:hypothetical protein
VVLSLTLNISSMNISFVTDILMICSRCARRIGNSKETASWWKRKSEILGALCANSTYVHHDHCLVFWQEDLIGTRRRAVNLEETTGSLRSSYEERLCQASCREAELLSIVHRQKAEISRLSNSSSADVSSGRVAHDSSKSTQITSLRDSIKSSQSTIVRDPIRSITTGNAAPDNIKSAEPSHMEGSKQDMTSERISSEDIMRGLTSLHIDF